MVACNLPLGGSQDRLLDQCPCHDHRDRNQDGSLRPLGRLVSKGGRAFVVLRVVGRGLLLLVLAAGWLALSRTGTGTGTC